MMEDFSIEVRVIVTTKTGPIILNARHFTDATMHRIMDDVEEFLKKREPIILNALDFADATMHRIMDDVEEFLKKREESK